MTSLHTVPRPRSWVTNVLLPFVVVLALTVAATTWWKQRTAPEPEPPQLVNLPAVISTLPVLPAQPAATEQPALSAQPSATAQAPAARSDASTVVPAMTAWVVHAGQDIAVSGDNISLPSGAQFAIKVRSNVDGLLAFFTINPNGVSTDKPLWASEVKAGSAVAGPGLRLQGAKGLETLRVILQPAAGGDEIEQHVQIWHD